MQKVDYANFDFGDGGFLCVENQLVDIGLWAGKLAIDGKTTGNVGGVAIQLAAGVDQQ